MRWPRTARTLVLGGARSGKSSCAERMLRSVAAVDYVACGPAPTADDPEWADRVARHRARRPATWETLETTDVAAVLQRPGSPVLLDCLTTWLARVMDECRVWDGGTGADTALSARIGELLAAWTTTPRRVVAVSNEAGSGIVPATPSGRRFRDELGVLNMRVAAAADRVWLVTAGIPKRLR